MSRTLLLGLDGATFTLLDRFMASGAMPFLRRFTDRGTRASLYSTVCPLTPPAWTTISTGRTPGNHGIFDFIAVDDLQQTPIEFRLADAQDVLTETVWSIAGRQGFRSASFNFPASHNTPPFNGLVMPGFVTSSMLSTSTQPESFWNEVQSLSGFDAEAVSWDKVRGRIPIAGSLELEDFREWVDYLKRKETGWFAVANHALTAHACQLLCIVFEGVDRLQHQAWALLDPALAPKNPTPIEQQFIDLSLSYFRHLDGLLEQLVRAAGDDARVIIVSDHGFGSTTEIFYPNIWLERQGYLAWKDETEHDREGLLMTSTMRGYFDSIDWERTSALALTTSANGIYLRVAKEPGQPGIQPADYTRVRDEIRRGLLAYRDPSTGTPVVTKILEREVAFPGQAMEHAPDLLLFLRDGGFLSVMRSDQIVRQRGEVKGTHRPNGILIASGPGIRQGQQISDQYVTSITPTLLYSLGLPIPEDLEGPAITDLFDAGFLAQNPPQKGPATVPPSRAESRAEFGKQDENLVLERLKALGYME